MNKIKIAIVGMGNCASSLIQGIEYYKNITDNEYIPGLMHNNLGGYKISDIKIVAGFDVDKRKIGTDISNAIFEKPNNTKKFSDVPILNVIVNKGPVLDGVAAHMKYDFQVDDKQRELSTHDIVSILKETEAQIIISYLPVGSQLATEFWAQVAIDARCAFINAIPQFIASNNEWADIFKRAGLPIIGDDIKSEVGATIVNRALVQTLIDRGAAIDNSWQLNIGGNTDFKNMLDPSRLVSKKISKTESISTLISNEKSYVYAGPNGHINCLNDNKISFMRIDFRIFGNIKCSLDIKLSVEDSPDSGGVMVDAIRIAKIAIDRKIGGTLLGPSAWMMKHPAVQYPDNIAKQMTEDFIKG